MRLGTILALLVLVTLVPLGLFAAGLIYTSWQQKQDLVNAQNVERARAISVAVDQEIQSTIAALNVLAAIDTIDAGDLRPFHDMVARLLPFNAGWLAVRLVDPSSKVLVNTDVPFGAPSTLEHDDWVQQVRNTGRPAVSTGRKDPKSGHYVVSVGVPVMRGNRVRFILGARITTSKFSEVLRLQNSSPDGVVSLIDSELTILARTRNEDKYIGGKPTDDFIALVRSGPQGGGRSRVLEGTASYSAHYRSALTGWTVGLGLPAESVDEPIRQSLWALVGVGITILGSGLFLAVRVRRRIVRAQVSAVSAARSLARGEPFTVGQSAVAEFNDLANGLREAGHILHRRQTERDEAERERAQAVERLEAALIAEHAARVAGERNEARLSVTLRSIGDAVIATNADGHVTILNPIAQALTGWPESEAIGRHIDDVFQTIDEHTRRPKPAPLDRIKASGEGASLDRVILMARDGRDIPIGDSVAPIRAANGTLQGIVVVFRDETAEHAAERQRAAALEREQVARRAAESLSREKDEFVATVSHELRTPLNAIFGWVAMLKMGSLDGAGQAKALEVIDRNTRVQAQLIEDLLDMARFIRGTVRLEMEPVDLATVLESAVDAVRPAADARRVTMKVEAPRGVALVSGDAGRLQQIAWNLLSNSIKFSDAGDEVDITVAQEGDDAVLRVRDTGAGIDRGFLPYVFERFRQETSDVTREHAGLGLGLSLVRHLTELHGGTVSAESLGKAQGATFTVRLPLLGARAGRPADADAAVAARDSVVAPNALQGLAILVVDDDNDARELLATALQQGGAAVTPARSVSEAVAALESSRIDVVITDIAMPHATGFDLMRHVRENPKLSSIPVIAVTAYARAEDRAQALALGFNAHVGKPFSPRALIGLVAELART